MGETMEVFSSLGDSYYTNTEFSKNRDGVWSLTLEQGIEEFDTIHLSQKEFLLLELQIRQIREEFING